MIDKVEIEFPNSFEGAQQDIYVGRLQLGHYVCRLFFTRKGTLKLYAPRSAVDAGDIQIYESRYTDEDFLSGFGVNPTKAG